jgi:receptor protein-tyrosine kinase
LAGIAGQVLLVVDAQRTERSEVEAALDVLEACPVLQLVLNRVRLTSNDSFGAHARYGAYDA